MERTNEHQCSGADGCGHYSWVHNKKGCPIPGCPCKRTFPDGRGIKKVSVKRRKRPNQRIIAELSSASESVSRAIFSTLDAVQAEVQRAMSIHEGMHSLHEAHSVIQEEFEEFWDEVKINPKKLSPALQAERMANLRSELIQTAAMCVRAIIDLKLQ